MSPARKLEIANRKRHRKFTKMLCILENPILSQVCAPLPFDDQPFEPVKMLSGALPVATTNNEQNAALVDFMTQALEAFDTGVGLAGPQVGLAYRIIAVHADRFSKGLKGGMKVMINPVITAHSETTNPGIEGCLSYPGFRKVVYCYDWLDVDYFDAQGVKHSERFEGWEGRVVQHEMKHLDGGCEVKTGNNGHVVMPAPMASKTASGVAQPSYRRSHGSLAAMAAIAGVLAMGMSPPSYRR